MAKISVAPIEETELVPVGSFLHANLNRRLSAENWARAIKTPWVSDSPNHGFMLVSNSEIVGVYLAFYSQRQIEGSLERFCNLGAWCVLPNYRSHSLLLLRALLGQKGFHFTDLSPSGNTIPINEKLGFRHLDTKSVLMFNLPWPSTDSGISVTSDSSQMERKLDAHERAIFRDHRSAAASKHTLLVDQDEHCYVLFRKDRRKGLPLFASVLYVSNPRLFLKNVHLFGRHVLFAHAAPMTLIELRVTGGRPAGGIMLNRARPKMFKSKTLEPAQIDYLYSELACVAW